MSAFLDEPPPRLKERRDQSNLFERVVGQAVRDLPRARELSPATLARIAARIGERAPAARRGQRRRWVLVTAAFLLGAAATASAQHLDGLRQWLTRIVISERRVAVRDPSVRSPSKSGGIRAEPRALLPGEADEAAPASQGLPTLEPAAAESVESSSGRVTADGQTSTTQVGPRAAMKPSRLQPGRRAGPAPPIVPPANPQPPDRRSETAKLDPAVLPPAVRSVHLAFVDQQEPSRSPPLAATPVAVPTATTPDEPSAASSQPARPIVARPKMEPSDVSIQQATKYLTQVVRALRVERSPERALLLLDRHADELEGEEFSREALLLRVEAMLALDRQDEVLRRLDRTSLTDGAAARALLLVRGQLRAAANRCAEGLGDFNLVLAESRKPPKPALLGRARCRQQLGDSEGARADLELYRREFPDDRAMDDPDGARFQRR